MGDVLTVTVGGQTTSYEYDLLGRMTATVTADGARTDVAYDALGNTVKTVDALGNETNYAYTADSLLREIRYANGATLTASYDLVGNLTAETDPEGHATVYEYDPVARMTAVTDALGNTTRYEYDAADNLARVTDALGHVTGYTYDALGNLTSETDALGNTVTYTYTPEGWLETVTDGSGHVTRYTYDRTGNVLTADYAGEQTETNTYNELGLLTTVTTAEGDTRCQYDRASRLISVTQPSGETVRYTYDSHGNRAAMTYPNGKTVKYAYDDMNRLVSVKGADGAKTRYEYDALGRRIATNGAKEDTVYAYDEVGNLVSQTTTGAYDLALAYTYDLSGRMTSESRTENGATLESVFTYDPLGQLTSFTRSDGQSESYTYDPVGNMTAKTQNGVSTVMGYNAANQLVQSISGTDKTTYTYDASGNLVRSENAGGARSYAYNALNLLQSFTREDGYTETYTYNANRLLSTVTTSEDLTTALTWDILYGDGVVIAESQNGQSTNYTYGLERISAQTGNTRTEYVYDGRGSVAGEVSYNNAWYTLGGLLAKKTVTTKSYTPFGEQIGEAVSGFGYNGEYYNAATGMIYLRARFYAPEMNRFGQKDILRGDITSGTSLNRYLYVRNDPVDYIDPSGNIGILGAAAIIGGVVGGVLGAVQSVRQQKANNNGSVSVGKVIRDTLIGAAVGATSAVVATVAATALVATVGATTITGAASLTLTQSIGVGMLSSAAGGAAGRYTNSALNNRFSPEKPPTNPIQEATNPKAVIVDTLIGGLGGAITHIMTGGVYETLASRQHEQDMRASQNSRAGESKDPIPQPKNGNSARKPTVENTQSEKFAVGCGEGGSGTVKPKDVRYMQSSIKNQTGDYTVLDNAQALKDSTLKPSDLPEIRIWRDNDGNLWTLDHRRLAAFRIAGVDEVPFRWATDEEVASQMWKMTTQTGGTSIKLKLENGKSIIIDN